MYTALIAVSEIGFFLRASHIVRNEQLRCVRHRLGLPSRLWYGGNACTARTEIPAGVVYQYVGVLEDSFDYDGMMASERFFGSISDGIRIFAEKTRWTHGFSAQADAGYVRNAPIPAPPAVFPAVKTFPSRHAGSMCPYCAKAAGLPISTVQIPLPIRA